MSRAGLSLLLDPRNLLLSFLLLGTASAANAQPTFTKTFSPNTIGPGSASTLTFLIDNTAMGAIPVDLLAFTDILPAGVSLATPSSAATTCTNGVLTAPDGGTTLSLTGGQVAAGAQCTVTVNVTSTAMPGPGMSVTHTNTSGDLTSSAGNSGPATDDLTVTSARPGFTKSFAPASISLGGVSTLTLTIDNSVNGSAAFLVFTDNLPAGMVVASPSNATNGCNGTFTATPGTSVVSLLGGFVAAFGTCSMTVDVTTTFAGRFENTTTDLTISGTPSGKATAVLDVTLDFLTKAFLDDPVAPGGTVTLEFTVANLDRSSSATNISFTDDLNATLPGLAVTGALPAAPCGAGSTLTGSSLLTLSGGNLGPGASCTFSVTLLVPAMASPGTFANTTSVATADVGGSPFVGNAATDGLVVSPVPLLTKSFIDDPAVAGGTVTLRFTITNTSSVSAATGITFTDNLNLVLSGLAVSSFPTPNPGFCGAGATMTNIAAPGVELLVTGGSLAAGASCTFDVSLQLPTNPPSGTFVNTTSAIDATVGGVPVTGAPATDSLVVVGGPTLVKSFTDDPVAPGGTVTLEFTLSHDAGASGDATDIAFTDDLNAALSGLSATGLPLLDVCGTGSQISGTTNLSFTGGTLSPGASCTFSVTVDVPAGATPGNHLNTTSSVTATVGGLSVTENPASDPLTVTGLSMSKSFTDDPAFPGGMVTLEFVVVNVSAVSGVTDIVFTDNLDAALSGLTVVPSPLAVADVCGLGSSLVGVGGSLSLGAGNLGPASSCNFSVTLQVPAAAAPGLYSNVTSPVTALVGGAPVTVPGAADNLEVVDPLTISKTFTDDPVLPGGTVTLEFTIVNVDPVQAATNVAFTDDLGAVLAGLAAVGLPASDVCGAGSSLSGVGVVTLMAGSLPPGGSCTFSVPLLVPAGAPAGVFVNTTGTVTGDLGGVPVTGNTATDQLTVAAPIPLPAFSKSFAPDPTVTGGVTTLTFVIDNTASGVPATGLDFTDNLPAGMTVATPANASTTCGGGVLTATSGTGVVNYTGGSVPAAGTCTIQVDVTSSTGGVNVNVTGDLTSSAGNSGPANANVTVNPQPAFTKVFAPDPALLGGTSTLTFTIDNSMSTVDALALDLTDNLPAGVVVATPGNAATTCTGGTLTAVSGSGTVTYTGGTVAAGASCTVTVDVTGTAPGVHVNVTVDLTSSLGNSGPASDTLTVDPQPLFTKSFSPDPITLGTDSTLTFTVDNSGSTTAATGLAFTDSLTGMVVASPNGAVDGCAGTLSATPGAGLITYTGGTVAAGAICTISVDVTGTAVGTNTNTTGNLTSSLGTSGPASGTLTVEPLVLFTKSFAPTVVEPGEPTTLTFTIDNTASSLAGTGLAFTDNLPAGMTVADPANPSNTCGGTLTATPGASVVSLTGGTVAAGAVCDVQVDVLTDRAGVSVNVTEVLTSAQGSSNAATAVLNVVSAIPTLGTWGLLLLGVLIALLGAKALRT